MRFTDRARNQCNTSRINTMPWSRLRANRPGGVGGRRHSVIETTLAQEGDMLDSGIGARQTPLPSAKSPSPLRNSFEPQAVPDAPSSIVDRPENPVLMEAPPRRQRFSMLKYRHASDPQISKTARDQTIAPAPPMPAGKLQDWRVKKGGRHFIC